MKIKLLSDLHMEMGYLYSYKKHDEDVVVLAGDISAYNKHYKHILYQIPDDMPIILIAGNHEYYGSSIQTVNGKLNELAARNPNVHFLNNTSCVIGGIDFFGGIMRTDLSLDGDIEKSVHYAGQYINDFRHTEVDATGRLFTPQDHIAEFKLFEQELIKWLDTPRSDPKVVLSHFIPHPEAIATKYLGSPVNPYFTQDMSKYMGWKGAWMFGHTHTSFDFMEGDTRVVCNPKGYGRENEMGFVEDLIIEL